MIKMINYYVGTDGPTIKVETIGELFEAIDLLHTQVMDAEISEDALRILEEAMEKLDELL
jgi:hypothetical protein